MLLCYRATIAIEEKQRGNDEDLKCYVCEVAQAGVAYVLRRNPVRAVELAASRADKQARVEHFIADRHRYLG